MAETGAPLAGEMSGPYLLCRPLVRVRRRAVRGGAPARGSWRGRTPLSAIRKALPQVVNTPELRFDCDDTRKFPVIEEVAARLRSEGAKVAEIDGVRVLTPDGWWLLRASNTQAVLVARAEATTEPDWSGSRPLWWPSSRCRASPRRIFRAATPAIRRFKRS